MQQRGCAEGNSCSASTCRSPQICCRADNNFEHLKEELELALGAEFMQLHRLVLERAWALKDNTALPGSKNHLEQQLDITLKLLTGEPMCTTPGLSGLQHTASTAGRQFVLLCTAWGHAAAN